MGKSTPRCARMSERETTRRSEREADGMARSRAHSAKCGSAHDWSRLCLCSCSDVCVSVGVLCTCTNVQ